MSIYNDKHRPHYLNFHLFTPKSKKIDLEYFSRTGYSIGSYGVCGRTKTTDVYIDRIILCSCKTLIQKMIYLFKKNQNNQVKVTNNREHEKYNKDEIKIETLSKPFEKKEKTYHVSNF